MLSVCCIKCYECLRYNLPKYFYILAVAFLTFIPGLELVFVIKYFFKNIIFPWLPLVPSLSSKSHNMNDLKEIETKEDCFGG